jgi:hypothetical protein
VSRVKKGVVVSVKKCNPLMSRFAGANCPCTSALEGSNCSAKLGIVARKSGLVAAMQLAL